MRDWTLSPSDAPFLDLPDMVGWAIITQTRARAVPGARELPAADGHERIDRLRQLSTHYGH